MSYENEAKDERGSKVKFWICQNKEALAVLKPIRELQIALTKQHCMSIPHLSDSIRYLDKAIKEQEERLEEHEKELDEIYPIRKFDVGIR